MQFRSVKRSNFSGGARAVAREMDQIFQANRQSATDFTMLAKESVKGRSQERRAAMDAEAAVAKAGLRAASKTRGYKDTADAIVSKGKANAGKTRMAGVVGALGSVAGGFLYKEDKKAEAKERALREQRWAEHTEKLNEFLTRPTRTFEPPEKPPTNPNLDTTIPERPEGSVQTPGSTAKPKPGAKPQPSTAFVPTPQKDGESVGMRYMQDLTKGGMSPVQAAAMVGHLDYESDGFRAMEEYVDNHLGTRGFGHLQWTNIPGNYKPGGQRRADFEKYSKNNNLDPSSYEANFGFLNHEFHSGQGVWTNGGSSQGFYQISDLTEASDYLRNNYIRPSKGSEAERIRRSQGYLTQFNNLNNN